MSQPLRVLTPELELLGEIDDYESLIFTRVYHGIGSFELHINLNKPNASLLQKGRLIMLSPTKVGIIKHYEVAISEDGAGGETLKVTGPALSGILKQRVTVPPVGQAYDRLTALAETVMRHYVTANAISPVDSSRAFTMLINSPDLTRGGQLTWQSRYKQLDEELEAIALASGLGWVVKLDLEQGKWVFDVLQGRDLTSTQDTLPPVIFSVDYDNIESQQYVDSDLNYRNVGYVGGQGEGEEREIVVVGTGTGLARHEVFIDARDIGEGSEDPPPSPEQITARLIARGDQKLAEYAKLQTFEAQILTHGPFAYGTDWDLGDIVTVQNRKWGVTLDARITEVTEVYEPAGFRLSAVFGHNQPTLVSKLKQELSQVGAEVRR